MNQTDITPVKKQTTLDLVLEGINQLKGSVNELKATMTSIERRTDSALDLAFQAHEKAKTALWARTTWAPFVVSAVAVGLSALAVGVAWAR